MLVLTPSAGHAATTYNLRTDWSDTANPNGVWAYRAGDVVLPHLPNWGYAGWPFTQSGWGASLPFWFKAVELTPEPEDWQPGDVVVHTQDDFNGSGNGPANLTWTSPISGIVAISGGVWMGRDVGRGNEWRIYVGTNLVSTGNIGSGDPYSRTNPFTFDLGSGGQTALQDIHVAPGDVISLEIVRTSIDGDFVGVDFAVSVQDRMDLLASIAVACVDICWAGRTNRQYQVQYSSDLTTNTWVNFGSLLQGSGTNCVTDSVRATEKRFYRVVDAL